MVTDFLTPSIASNYTYPPGLKDEIAGLPDVHPYEFDVSDFRTPDKGKIRDALVRMTDKRFALARHLMTTKPWDFFMMVEMGTDRVHHAFWQYMDPAHHRYEPGNPFEIVIPDYYEHVDRKIGELLEVDPRRRPRRRRLRPRRPVHGRRDRPQRVAGPEGLPRPPRAARPPRRGSKALKVDWARTTAWGSGGYYGRLFLNVKGREPQGLIAPEDYEATRDRLIAELEALGDPEGRPIGTRVLKPEDLYRTVRGAAPPDLFVYFGNLRWRSVGTVGTGLDPHLRERHRPRRRQPRPGRDDHRRRPRRPRPGARRRAARSATSRRRSSASSASTSPPTSRATSIEAVVAREPALS